LSISLPSLTFELLEWNDKHFSTTRHSEERLRKMASTAGTNSDQFKNSLKRMFRGVCVEKNPADFYIRRGLDVRAFTFLMATSEDFFRCVELSSELLSHLREIRAPMSKISLTQFIRGFLTHFDLHTEVDDLKRWAQFLQDELSQYVGRKGDSQLQVFVANRELIFSTYGPSRIVRQAQEENIDFDMVLDKYSLVGFSDARFTQLCRYQYYLQTLKSLNVGEDHSVLSEIVKRDVVNSPYTANKQLGHEILEILIDRSGTDSISSSWQRAVLEIAGDPRVPKSAAKYQQWWSLLGDNRIAKVRGWLSSFDLKLFLEFLEQSAKESGNADMERMFGDRKIFMEGLLAQGLVTDSRLFLSKSAQMYLKKSYRKEELPAYARLNGTQTSVIYLNLSGRVRMIEGSHSFKLKLMDKLPSALGIDDYSVSTFDDSKLRTSPGWSYQREYGNYSGNGFVEFAHHTQLSWQHRAIEYLKDQGLQVDISKLISADKYRMYKNKFGAD